MDPTMNSEPNREEATSTPPKSKNLDYLGSTSIKYRDHSYPLGTFPGTIFSRSRYEQPCPFSVLTGRIGGLPLI